jgi:AcrR family transcriptional regulator
LGIGSAQAALNRRAVVWYGRPMSEPRPRDSVRRLGRPAAAESAETRARILRAAREHFAAGGYRRTSNQAIAAAAGVTPTALYHYFASKADLFAAAHEAALAVLLDAYRAAAAGSSEPVEQLCALVEANAALNRAHPGLAEFLAVAPLEARRHPELATKLGARGDEISRLLREILEAGVRSGRLARGLDLDATVAFLTAASFGLAWIHGVLPSAEAHEAALAAFQSLLRGQLLSPGDSRPPRN